MAVALVNNDTKELIKSYRGFSERGHTLEETRQFETTMRNILFLLSSSHSLNEAKEILRKNSKLPMYRLFDDEIKVILEAEKMGAGKSGKLYEYTDYLGGQRDVIAYPCMDISYREGDRDDILVVFSGHPQSAVMATKAFYSYVKRNGKIPFGIMFLGLTDNQNMTEFNPAFKLRKNSEYGMYLQQMLELGVPYDLLFRLLMTPGDTSTSENIELIKATMSRYLLRNVNLICVTYPAYQMRVATELPFRRIR